MHYARGDSLDKKPALLCGKRVPRIEPDTAGDILVELRGIEPLTYALRTRRSPS